MKSAAERRPYIYECYKKRTNRIGSVCACRSRCTRQVTRQCSVALCYHCPYYAYVQNRCVLVTVPTCARFWTSVCCMAAVWAMYERVSVKTHKTNPWGGFYSDPWPIWMYPSGQVLAPGNYAALSGAESTVQR
jgi:hypothetical protein